MTALWNGETCLPVGKRRRVARNPITAHLPTCVRPNKQLVTHEKSALNPHMNQRTRPNPALAEIMLGHSTRL